MQDYEINCQSTTLLHLLEVIRTLDTMPLKSSQNVQCQVIGTIYHTLEAGWKHSKEIATRIMSSVTLFHPPISVKLASM